jgi:hypothetical protein
MTNGKSPTYSPGGGGGGATGTGGTGGGGAAGQGEVVFTAGTTPNWNIIRFLIDIPSTGDVDNSIVVEFETNGTVERCKLTYNTAASGTLTMQGLNSVPSVIFTAPTITGVNGKKYMISMELNVDGTTVQYQLQYVQITSAAPVSPGYTAVAGSNTMGEVIQVNVNPSGTLAAIAIGQVTVQYGYESLSAVYNAIIGYAGELAATRFLRLCAEEGITAVLVGNATDTPAMGPQPDDTLINVLQQTEDLDRGQLFETMYQFGLGYRTWLSMTNQSPKVVIDYSLSQISPPFQPTEDDQLTRNLITVSRFNGSSYTTSLASGNMSTQSPPNGVGKYSYSITVNAFADNQLPAVAAKIIALGTVDEYRYPQITFNLARTSVQAIFSAIMSLAIGDYAQVINPPSFLTPDNINQIILGFSIQASALQLTFVLNCIPESPFEI